MNTRSARRQPRHAPVPSTLAAGIPATPNKNAEVSVSAAYTAMHMQPLVEAVVQELLARLLVELSTQCVVHVSMNARGMGQFEVRRTYATLDAAKEQVQRDITDLVNAIRMGLQDSHVTLASDGQ